MNKEILSIIIVNYKVRELLLNCLQSIYTTTKDVELDIIVVDNASGDGSVEEIRKRFPQVRIIANSLNVGFAAANNQAMPLVRGKYILLLNPDTIVHPGTIKKLFEFIYKNKNVGIVGCKLIKLNGEIQYSVRTFPSIKENILWSFGLDKFFLSNKKRIFYSGCNVLDVDYLNGSCLMLRKEALCSESLFDERFFMYGEEKDLCFRLKKRNWRICFVPTTTITHLGGQSSLKCDRRSFIELQKSQILFFKKHYSKIKAFFLALSWGLVLFNNSIVFLIQYLFNRNPNVRHRVNLFCYGSKWYFLKLITFCLVEPFRKF